MNPTEIQVFVCVNPAGEYQIGLTEDAAREAFETEVGGDGVRTVYRKAFVVPPVPEVVDV